MLMETKSNTVLIIGGAGYIGSHTNKLLHQLGYQTLVLDNLIKGRRDLVKWGEFIEGDLNDEFILNAIFSKYEISTVMYFAETPYLGDWIPDSGPYRSSNKDHIQQILKVMHQNQCDQIIVSSSCSVYGEPEYLPLDENHQQNPVTDFGKSKWNLEQQLMSAEQTLGIQYTILRYVNAAGADPEGETGEYHQPETHLIPLIFDAALDSHKVIQIYGDSYPTPDGTCVRDFIHVTDLAKAHQLAMERLMKTGLSAAYNLGNGKGYSVLEMINLVSQMTGKNIRIHMSEKRVGDPPVVIVSSEKAKTELNWIPHYSNIESILRTAWNWHISRDKRHFVNVA